MAPKAAPMMMPTARSTTFPRKANFLNSSSTVASSPENAAVRARIPALSRSPAPEARPLIDETGVHHGGADLGAGLLRNQHHRQPHRLGALAEQRKRIFGRRRIGLQEQ